jgi:uncharacterized membrane protein
MDHLWLKAIHILSAMLVFGTGLGIAFFMWTAHRTGDARTIAAVARNVVIADAIFTAPGVVGLLVTGYVMARRLDVPFLSGWLGLALALFVLVGVCWLPVLWLQELARRLATDAARRAAPLPPRYFTAMRWWIGLGWPAFLSVIGILVLMVWKPAL